MWAEGILDVDFLKVHYELCEVSNGKNIWANCPFLLLGKVRVDKQELLCSQKRWLPTSTIVCYRSECREQCLVDPFLSGSGSIGDNVTWEDCFNPRHDKLTTDISEVIYYIGKKILRIF